MRIQNGHPSKQEGAVGIIRESSWVVVLALAPSAVRVSPGMAQVGGNRFGDAVNCFRRTYHASLRDRGNGRGQIQRDYLVGCTGANSYVTTVLSFLMQYSHRDVKYLGTPFSKSLNVSSHVE